MSKKYDISSKSDMRKFSNDLENAFWQTSANSILDIFKKDYPNLTEEQYQSAYEQIPHALSNGIENFEIKV